jgi:hypothetical protein
MTFEKMTTDVHYGDGSVRREELPDVRGYTDHKNKTIYIRDDYEPEEVAAKDITHEWLHTLGKLVHNREELMDEENHVHYTTELLADSIGYFRNPDYYNNPNDPYPDYQLIGERIGRSKPAKPTAKNPNPQSDQPSANAMTKAYSNQLEKKPAPPADPKEAKRRRNEVVGTRGAYPVKVKPLKLKYPNKKIK